jgi:DNA-binding NarL/FixJ family response regulator
MIVDDHPITRQGLRAAFSMYEEIEVVGEAASGAEAVFVADEVLPQVVFMDIRMPGMSGIDATRLIVGRHPSIKVIVFSVDESRSTVSEAVRAGVSGYLLKDIGGDELVNAARMVMEGKAVIHPSLTRTFLEEAESASHAEREVGLGLTDREVEILQRVAYGSTTRQVADDLGISAHTVKTHVDRIFEKLSANDRAQAVAIAVRRGLID